MKRHFDVTLWVEVFDPQQLLQAALAHPHSTEAGMTEADYLHDNGEVDIGACLVMLLDPGSLPGCSLQESSAEESEVNTVDFGDERN